MSHWEIIVLFFTIAFIYASVGFGGGSSYLAVLALYSFPYKEMRLIALVCNIIVVTGGTIVYIQNKQVNWKKIIPIAVVSVPMAYAGARIKISQDTFFILLGISLLIAGALLWIKTRSANTEISNKTNYVKDGLLGGAIGFLSGMVGIGGGIFLSPVLNLMNWNTAKKIAATASVFILVNSISGIAGQLSQMPANINYTRIALLCAAVLLGGQLGSRMSAGRFNLMVIKRITAVLVFFAGLEVLNKHLFN